MSVKEMAPSEFPLEPLAHPTLADVAAIAGVSIKTASRVMNGSEQVSDETAEKVKKAANLVGYRSNRIARELRIGSLSNLVGMIISDLANPFYAGLAAGAEERLGEEGLDLILATARDDGEREKYLIESLLERRVRGLIIVPSGEDYSYLHQERKRGFSFVFADRPAPYLDADSVTVDNRGGITACLDYLLEKKCKKIAIIADTTNIWTASERIEAFKQAILSRRVDIGNTQIVTDIHTSDEAAIAATHLLKNNPDVDGIIATNDLIAMGVGQVISEGEHNVHVVSFDLFATANLLKIATLDHDPKRLGRLSAEQLLRRFQNPTDSFFVTEVMKVEMKRYLPFSVEGKDRV
jgi:LacI family transcriptional regulator